MISLMAIIGLIIGILYLLLMVFFAMGFIKARQFSPELGSASMSVVIPFRNEEDSLPDLLRSLSELKSSNEVRAQILFVNDGSHDQSWKLVSDFIANGTCAFPCTLLESEGKGKKQALLKGIQESEYDWIVTTDADCVVPPEWLIHIGSEIHHGNTDLWVMPVTLKSDGGIFQQLQQIENMALTAMNAGAINNGQYLSAQGANLAFKKSVFFEVGGYAPEWDVAGGDDEFLLARIASTRPNAVGTAFNPDLTVQTRPCYGFRELISQRTRWAAKAQKHTLSMRSILVAVPTVFMALLLLSVLIGFLFQNYALLGGLLFYKWFGDFVLYMSFKRYFKLNPFALLYIILMPVYQLIYMVPVVYKLIFEKKVIWKGRQYGNQ